MIEQDLINFEESIKKDFLAAKIRHPVHFSKGNEHQLIEIFERYSIGDNDFCFSNHRSHYHALLKGIPPNWIKEQIYHGNSMHLMSNKYKFFASSIVGGCLPIALGVAMGIKRKESDERVFVFLGDMASTTGIFHECITYASNFNLPIYFVIECNSLSTNSPTYDIWGVYHAGHKNRKVQTIKEWGEGGILKYCYERQCEHINTKEWVEFR